MLLRSIHRIVEKIQDQRCVVIVIVDASIAPKTSIIIIENLYFSVMWSLSEKFYFVEWNDLQTDYYCHIAFIAIYHTCNNSVLWFTKRINFRSKIIHIHNKFKLVSNFHDLIIFIVKSSSNLIGSKEDWD